MTEMFKPEYTLERLREIRAYHRKMLLYSIVSRRRSIKFRRFMLRALRNLDREMRQRGVV